MIRLVLVLVLGFATAAAAQAPADHDVAMDLPHGIPDLCATDAAAVLVPTGTTKTLSGTQTISCLGVHGTVILADNLTLTVGTLLVYADGTLQAGTAAAPARGVTVSFAGALDLKADPEQFGIGLLALGTVRLAGVPVTPFVRLASEAAAGATTLTLEAPPTGWAAGDRLVLPDSRTIPDVELWAKYTKPQADLPTIASVADRTVTLTAPLAYSHPGARNAAGTVVALPHVAHLTRSITLRSATPTGTRGHVLASYRASLDIANVRFQQLGRTTLAPLDSTTFDAAGAVTKVGTNQIGRYPLHLHHLFGPLGLTATTPQFSLVGNAVDEGSKWGIVVHNSHYGRVADNVLDHNGGAQVMLEDGSESFNVITHNFALRGYGTGGREGGGREASGFYAKGPNSSFVGNVSAQMMSDNADSAYGYKYFLKYLGTIRVPNFPGADTSQAGQYTAVDGNGLPLREFRDNEAYGGESGLTFWWLGAFGNSTKATERSAITRLRVWNVANKGIYQYESALLTVDGLRVTGGGGRGSGFFGGDYWSDRLILTDLTLERLAIGLSPSTATINGTVVTAATIEATTAVRMMTVWTSSYRADKIPPRLVTLQGVKTTGPTAIEMQYSAVPVRSLTQADRLLVTAWQGTAGDDFQVYYPQQAPSFVVPQTVANTDGTPKVAGAPVAGLTNAQTWATYSLAIAGTVAACTTTQPGITGFVCRTAPTNPCVTDPLVVTYTANYPMQTITATDTRGCTWTPQ